MGARTKHLTIIVVPDAQQQTRQFRISPTLLIAAGVAVLALAIGTGALYKANEKLAYELAQTEGLQELNARYRTEIEALGAKVLQVQGEVEAIREVERELAEALAGQENQRERTRNAVPASRGGPVARPGARAPAQVDAGPTRLDYINRPGASERQANADPKAAVLEKALKAGQLLDQQMAELNTLDQVFQAYLETAYVRNAYLASRPTGYPVAGGTYSDPFGWRRSPFTWAWEFHKGLDIALPYGTPVSVTANGTVTHAGWRAGGYGYTVIVDHGHDFTTVYAHLSDWDVKAGQQVRRGDIIGYVGSSGLSTGPHLHYEVFVGNEPVDPSEYLK